MAQPLPKTGELADLLQLQMDADRPNDLALARISREAAKIVKECTGNLDVVAEAYSLQGGVAFLRHRDEEGCACFENALRLSTQPAVLLNYTVMLRRRLYPRAAFEKISTLATRFRDDRSVLGLALDVSCMTLQLDAAAGYLESLERLKVLDNESAAVGSIVKSPGCQRFTANVIDRLGAFDPLLALVESAASVVRERHGDYQGWRWDVTSDGEMMLYFDVLGSVESLVETNFAIADEIVSNHDDTLMDLLTISCTTSGH